MASGLYDTPNRELHPTQGRWISPDPSGMSAANPANPQSWNRYAYVGNGPLGASDPSGLDPSNFLGVRGEDNIPACVMSPACVEVWANVFDPFDDLAPPLAAPGPPPPDVWGGMPGPFTSNRAFGDGTDLVVPPAGPLLQALLQAFGVPTDLNCPAGLSPLCGGISPISDVDSTANIGRPCLAGAGPLQVGQSRCGAQPQPSKLDEASNAALHTFVFGQAIATGVGCGVGALVAAGGTAATETYPLAGATIPAGCVGGGLIGFFEALPYSTLGAIADFGWTYWKH